VRIGRVTGWDGWIRDSGKIQLSSSAASSTPPLTEIPPGEGQGLLLEAWDSDRPAPDGEASLRRLTDLHNEHWGPAQTHPTMDQGIRIKWATPRGSWPGA
jgi:hypothetical protein